MKLLYILSEYLPNFGGGIISYYADTLPRLVEDGHTVDVLVASREFADHSAVYIKGVQVSYLQTEFLEKFDTGFERFKLGFPTFEAFLPAAWAAYEQVNHGKGYDLVETTDFPLLFAPWVISRDSPPVVISLHGSCGQLEWYESKAQGTLDSDLLRLVESVSFSSARALYTNSERNARFWREITHRSVEVLLPMYIQENDLLPLCVNNSETGLVVGRCQSWKGPQVLCEAMKMLPQSRMRWIGRDMVNRESGITQSEILRRDYPDIAGKRLIFENAVGHDEIKREISSAAFLCVPSNWDVFNMTVVEAMFLGTPVVCSRQAGAAMLIKHLQNGYLFDSDSPSELTEGIHWATSLSKEDKKLITQSATETVRSMLDPSGLALAREEYYKEIISNSAFSKIDEWLCFMLSPRNNSLNRSDILKSFKGSELIKATINRGFASLKRKINISRFD